MSRINISKETKALIQAFAAAEGHNNLSAALSTIVHLGVPILLSRGVQERYSQALSTLANDPPIFSTEHLEQANKQLHEAYTPHTDDVIERFALLLDDWS